LYAEQVEYEWLAPMPGFRSDKDVVRISDDLSIIRMDKDQVIDCLRSNLITGMPDFPTFKMVADRYAIRRVISVQKEVDASLSDPLPLLEVLREIESVVIVLRLYKPDRVSLSGVVQRNGTLLPGQGRSIAPYAIGPPGRWSAYRLTEEDEESLVELWRSTEDKKQLSIAMRRYSDAGERRRSEDRLVDLMIAAEQLFLTGERQELGFKLALRAAFFLGADASARKDIFAVMGRGYSARSDLVHANQSRVSKLRPTLEDLNRRLEQLSAKPLLKP
jgi:hypothetical protein